MALCLNNVCYLYHMFITRSVARLLPVFLAIIGCSSENEGEVLNYDILVSSVWRVEDVNRFGMGWDVGSLWEFESSNTYSISNPQGGGTTIARSGTWELSPEGGDDKQVIYLTPGAYNNSPDRDIYVIEEISYDHIILSNNYSIESVIYLERSLIHQ